MVLKKDQIYCMKTVKKYRPQIDPAESEQVDVSEFVKSLATYVIDSYFMIRPVTPSWWRWSTPMNQRIPISLLPR